MIHRRGAGYGVAVYDPATKRMRWVGTYQSEAAAKRAEAEATAQIGGLAGGYPTRWLSERPRPAARTRRMYAQAVRLFIDRFGEGPLDTLEPAELWSWAAAQQRPLAVAIQTMFSDAIRDGAHPGPNPLRRFAGSRGGGRRPGRLSEGGCTSAG